MTMDWLQDLSFRPWIGAVTSNQSYCTTYATMYLCSFLRRSQPFLLIAMTFGKVPLSACHDLTCLVQQASQAYIFQISLRGVNRVYPDQAYGPERVVVGVKRVSRAR